MNDLCPANCFALEDLVLLLLLGADLMLLLLLLLIIDSENIQSERIERLTTFDIFIWLLGPTSPFPETRIGKELGKSSKKADPS